MLGLTKNPFSFYYLMGKKKRPDAKKIHWIKFETPFAFPNNMVIQVKVL